MARPRTEITSDMPEAKRSDRRSRKRISVYLDDNGAPDWGAMPEEHRKQLGIENGAPVVKEPEAPPQIEPAVIGLLYATATRIEAAIVAPRFGVSGEQAMAALTPPDQIAGAMNEATARVLNKYSGTLGRWQDEIVLASLLVTWQASAFAQLRAMRAENEANKPAKPEPVEIRQSGSVETKPDAPPAFATDFTPVEVV